MGMEGDFGADAAMPLSLVGSVCRVIFALPVERSGPASSSMSGQVKKVTKFTIALDLNASLKSRPLSLFDANFTLVNLRCPVCGDQAEFEASSLAFEARPLMIRSSDRIDGLQV
jgi:hypothetical protein